MARNGRVWEHSVSQTPHSPACAALGKWDVTHCQQLCANKIVHMAAVGGMGLKREKFLSLTIAKGLQADWQLQSTQFPALVQMTRHLWDRMGEERRQNKPVSVYFYTADPSAPLHSWQGLECSLDPSNKSLFMRHGNPPPLSTPFGLDCPGRGYFGHHRWLLHLAECRMEPADASPHHYPAQPPGIKLRETPRICGNGAQQKPTGGA